jgi:hypothetical protein
VSDTALGAVFQALPDAAFTVKRRGGVEELREWP